MLIAREFLDDWQSIEWLSCLCCFVAWRRKNVRNVNDHNYRDSKFCVLCWRFVLFCFLFCFLTGRLNSVEIRLLRLLILHLSNEVRLRSFYSQFISVCSVFFFIHLFNAFSFHFFSFQLQRFRFFCAFGFFFIYSFGPVSFAFNNYSFIFTTVYYIYCTY